MSLLDKEPVQRVEKILKDFDKSQNIIVLETSARTALEAASSLGCEVGAIVKSLLFKTENSFTLCLVAGDKRASLNRIKKALKIKDASMASAEDVKNITGYTIGGKAFFGPEAEFFVFDDVRFKNDMNETGFKIDSKEGP